MIKSIICCFGLLITLTLCIQNPLIPILSQTGIMLLDDKNFTEVTGLSILQDNYQNGQIINSKVTPPKQNTDYLILFYNFRCGHCVRFVNEVYSKIAEKLKGLDFDVIPAALQWQVCEQFSVANRVICQQFKVTAYPTLYYFTKEGQMFLYPTKVERTLQNVMKFVREGHQNKQMTLQISNHNLRTNEFPPRISSTEEKSNQNQGQFIFEEKSPSKQSTPQKNLNSFSYNNEQTSIYYTIFVIIILFLTFKLIAHSSDSLYGNPRIEHFEPFQIQHTQAYCIQENSQEIQIAPSLHDEQLMKDQFLEVEEKEAQKKEKEAKDDENETVANTLKSIGIEQMPDQQEKEDDVLQEMDDSLEDED